MDRLPVADKTIDPPPSGYSEASASSDIYLSSLYNETEPREGEIARVNADGIPVSPGEASAEDMHRLFYLEGSSRQAIDGLLSDIPLSVSITSRSS